MSKKELLKKIQDSNGKYTMLALDQRGSFVRAYSKTLGKKATKKQVTEAKKRIIQAIGEYPSGILIDPIYCLSLAKIVPKGLMFCVEKSGYVEHPQGRKTQLQPKWGVKQALKKGALAIKINILYNPEASKAVREHQHKIAEKIGKQCKKADVPYLLEFVVYPLDASFKKKLPDLVYRSAKEFAKKKYNADILKIQYPGNVATCKKITMNIKKPWILLTAGIPFNEFKKNLAIAKKGGCSGFLAGRAVWQEVLKIKSIKKQKDWLNKKGVQNIKTLLRIMK
jgi:tagatose 1,6-diphosphate aldolase